MGEMLCNEASVQFQLIETADGTILCCYFLLLNCFNLMNPITSLSLSYP